jgi:hypothetical protein
VRRFTNRRTYSTYIHTSHRQKLTAAPPRIPLEQDGEGAWWSTLRKAPALEFCLREASSRSSRLTHGEGSSQPGVIWRTMPSRTCMTGGKQCDSHALPCAAGWVSSVGWATCVLMQQVVHANRIGNDSAPRHGRSTATSCGSPSRAALFHTTIVSALLVAHRAGATEMSRRRAK